MTWQIHPIARYPDFHQAWDALLAECRPIPFLESRFLQPLIEEFGTGNECLALATEGNTLRAVAIVAPGRLGLWQTFQPSQLPLGPWIAQPGTDATVLAGALVKTLPGFALGLGLTQLDPLLQPRTDACPGLNTLDYIQTAWVDVEDSFDDYWNARGKNLRTNIRKQRTKLENDGIAATLDCIDQPEQVAAAMADYGALEIAGWKAEGGTATHPDNAQGHFYRKMLEAFCAQGRGRIYRYRFDDKTVAMDLCIAAGDTLVILKTAYDETYKTLSPSSLMRYEQLKQIFEAGKIKRIEFYGRVMEWHTRWTPNERTLYHANIFRWPILQTLRDYARNKHAEPST
jgi:CelD/BcsL family acetyltransferase involved in cellulose biosynthesis